MTTDMTATEIPTTSMSANITNDEVENGTTSRSKDDTNDYTSAMNMEAQTNDNYGTEDTTFNKSPKEISTDSMKRFEQEDDKVFTDKVQVVSQEASITSIETKIVQAVDGNTPENNQVSTVLR